MHHSLRPSPSASWCAAAARRVPPTPRPRTPTAPTPARRMSTRPEAPAARALAWLFARLAWWPEESPRCLAGAPGHPLTRELAALCAPEPAAALGGLSGLIDCALWDLAAATFETRREQRAYCERWSAAMIE